jgi:hypothetical protein
LAQWRARWFVLRADSFAYWDSEKDWLAGKAALGRLRVDGQLRCVSDGGPTALEWKFVAIDKSVVVRGTLQDKREWFDAVERCVDDLVAQAEAEGRMLLRPPPENSSTGRPYSPSISSTTCGYSGDNSSTVGIAEPVAEQDDEEAVDEIDDLFSAAPRESAGPEASAAATGLVDTPVSHRRVRSATGPSTATSLQNSTSHGRSSSNAGAHPSPFASAAAAPSPSSSATLSLAEQSALVTAREHSSRKAQSLFGWPASERVIRDFSCAVEKSIMLHGRMYVSRHFVAFESPLFYGTKLVIPVADILSVCEANQAIVFPNAIKIFVRPQSAPTPSSSSSSSLPSAAPDVSSTEPPPTPLAAATTALQTSYFFGSFGAGGRRAAFELITSLVNGTYDERQHYMHVTPEAIAAAIAATKPPATPTAGSSSTSTVDTGDGAASDEDGDDDGDEIDSLPRGRPGVVGRQKSQLDFGSDRPDHSSSGGGEGGGEPIEMKEMLETDIPGLSARAFFRLFFSDSALYSAADYHASRPGDTEYAASGWKSAALVPGAAAQGWAQLRDTLVRVPVIGSPMGPDSTRVMKVQKMAFVAPEGATKNGNSGAGGGSANNSALLLETVAVTPDVPFGDCFLIVDQWRVEDLADGSGCKLRIRCGIRFKSNPWKLRPIKSMLVSRALGDNKKGFEQHVAEQKAWMATHTAEVSAVAKAVASATNQNHTAAAVPKSSKRKSLGPSSSASSALALKSPPNAASAAGLAANVKPTAVVAAAKSPDGPAAALLAKLPAPLSKLGVSGLAGIGVGAVLLVWLLLWLFSGGDAQLAAVSSAATVATAAMPVPPSPSTAVGGAPDVSSPSSASPSAPISAAAGGSSSSLLWLWLAVTLLAASVGALAFRLVQAERQLASLHADVRALKAAALSTAASSRKGLSLL